MSKKTLKDISSTSKINDIYIKYDGETFKFNLNKELSISPDKINKELTEQPSYYGFLLLLRNRLLAIKEDLEREADKVYASKYLSTCDKINSKTNRPFSDKAAIQMALASGSYNLAKDKAIKAKQNFNDINSCVTAFEQRATLIQSLAANIRNEK